MRDFSTLVPRLLELSAHPDAQIAFFANHCLESIAQGEERRVQLCRTTIQAAALEWRAPRRRIFY